MTPSKQSFNLQLCGLCQKTGHNRRTCTVGQSTNPNLSPQNTVLHSSVPRKAITTPERSPKKHKMTHQYISESTLYVVFDLETTGLSRNKDKIIEISAEILDENSHIIPDGKFHSLVKPKIKISSFITSLTGISNEDVSTANDFGLVGKDFLHFLIDRIERWEVSHGTAQSWGNIDGG